MFSIHDFFTLSVKDYLALLIWVGSGAVLGFLISALGIFLVHLAGKKLPVLALMRKAIQLPVLFLGATVGAWAGFQLQVPPSQVGILALMNHLFLILTILGVGLTAYAATSMVTSVSLRKSSEATQEARRKKTQAQLFQRILQTTVIIGTILALLFTFPSARAPLASILGAAGIVSIVAGLAAQSTLGNVIAGVQLALTDAIRVGDTLTVEVSGGTETGVVEELTLTYVTLSLWNRTSVLLPSSYFTTQPFKNWTHNGTSQVAEVTLQLNWPAPVTQIRKKAEKLVRQNIFWDGESIGVHIVDSSDQNLTFRVTATTNNPSDKFNLEVGVREQLLDWVGTSVPDALPRFRVAEDPALTR